MQLNAAFKLMTLYNTGLPPDIILNDSSVTYPADRYCRVFL